MDVYCLLRRNPHFFSSISRKSPFFVCHLSAFPEKKVRNSRVWNFLSYTWQIRNHYRFFFAGKARNKKA